MGLGVFRFKKGQGDKMLPMLEEHAELLREFEGCLEAVVARSDRDPDRFVLWSKWTSIGAHGEMEKVLKAERDRKKRGVDFVKMSKWLKETPHFGVYRILD